MELASAQFFRPSLYSAPMINAQEKHSPLLPNIDSRNTWKHVYACTMYRQRQSLKKNHCFYVEDKTQMEKKTGNRRFRPALIFLIFQCTETARMAEVFVLVLSFEQPPRPAFVAVQCPRSPQHWLLQTTEVDVERQPLIKLRFLPLSVATFPNIFNNRHMAKVFFNSSVIAHTYVHLRGIQICLNN